MVGLRPCFICVDLQRRITCEASGLHAYDKTDRQCRSTGIRTGYQKDIWRSTFLAHLPILLNIRPKARARRQTCLTPLFL